jgi:GntR family transcriptional repressor for pyruvate dehydrogenase complex
VTKQPIEKTGFRTIQKMSVCEDIIEQIKELVRKNHYGLGSRLPSERELAEQLGVSRPSVREALRTLAILGVLQTRHGSGTQVSESSENILRAPFEFLMILDQPTLFELYETRALIEVFLAGRAAERWTDIDLEAIEAALDEMQCNVSNPKLHAEANVRFHEAVAAAAHNTVLGRVMTCLHDGIRICIEATQPAVSVRVSFEVHQEIFNAIRQRNPEEARRAMTKHMAIAMETLPNVQADERRAVVQVTKESI